MKHLWKMLVLLTFVWMFGLAFWALPQLPERMPVHWGFDGRPDRWGDKLEGSIGLFLLPALLSVAVMIVWFTSKIRKVEKDHLTPTLGVCVSLIGAVTQQQIVQGSLQKSAPIEIQWLLVLVGVMFVALGNVFPKLNPKLINGFEHAKRSPLAWYATMRILSRATMVVGLLFCALAFVRNELVFVSALVMIVPSILIGIGLLESKSFEIWKTDPHREELPRSRHR